MPRFCSFLSIGGINSRCGAAGQDEAESVGEGTVLIWIFATENAADTLIMLNEDKVISVKNLGNG